VSPRRFGLKDMEFEVANFVGLVGWLDGDFVLAD
jgi:hypothetical protein